MTSSLGPVARISMVALAAALAGLFVACSSNSPGTGGSGGGTSTGGKGTGGVVGTGSGGALASGGATASGGASGMGGVSASGGATSSGGNAGTGGRGGSGTGATAGSGNNGTGGVTGTGGGAGGATSAGFRCPAGPFSAPVLTGLTPMRVAGAPPSDTFNNNRQNFSIVEGPVWIGDALFFSEIGGGSSPPPSRILKLTGAGVVSIALANAGTNGLAVDDAGNLVGANHKDGAITKFALPGFTPSAIVSAYNGQRFDSPNDLTFRADGNLYFTDPDYQAPSSRPQTRTRLYRLAPGTTTPTVIDENRSQPNGVTLSPDGNTLYVTGSDGLFKYPVAANGSVGTGMKIVQSIGGGDGMAVDCAGNIYVSSNSTLVVVDPNATVLGTIAVPGVQGVTNAAFGGADHKTLYITALGSGTQSGLFSVTMTVPGYPY